MESELLLLELLLDELLELLELELLELELELLLLEDESLFVSRSASASGAALAWSGRWPFLFTAST